MGEREIYLSHDHRMMLEAEMFDELSQAVEQGRMTEEEMETCFLDWLETHREIKHPKSKGLMGRIITRW